MLQMSTSAQSVPFRKFELEERFPQKKCDKKLDIPAENLVKYGKEW